MTNILKETVIKHLENDISLFKKNAANSLYNERNSDQKHSLYWHKVYHTNCIKLIEAELNLKEFKKLIDDN
jgi:hypothetical protein